MRRATVRRRLCRLCNQFQSTLSMRRATSIVYIVRAQCGEFQSTLSMRRATIRQEMDSTNTNISIHALHEESDIIRIVAVVLLKISIHALHEESDYSSAMTNVLRRIISIHALHEESDRLAVGGTCYAAAFQSTLSMRRATNWNARHSNDVVFQSTLSMRRATTARPL